MPLGGRQMVSELSASRELHVEAVRRRARGPGERTVLVGADCLTAAALGELGGGRVGALVGAACLLLTVTMVGLYRMRLSLSALDDLPRTALAVGLAWMAVAWIAPAVREPDVLPPADSLRWWAAIFAGLVLSRTGTAALLRRRRRATGGQRTLILGTGRVAGRLARALRERPELGLDPVGLLGPSDPSCRQPLPVLGPVDRAAEIAAERSASHLVVAFSGEPDEDLVATLRRCWQYGLSVLVVPRLYEMNVSNLRAELVGGIPLVRMRPPAVRRLTWRIKRLLDIVFAGSALLLLTPVYAVCALAVRWETGRDGVIFRQERVGRDGCLFDILKFRSLTPSTDLESAARWNVTDDARIGPVGRLIRRTSLDELPQLVNVLRGEMSLVGPRPERPYFVETFSARHRNYQHRLRVPAGLTGWAQIHGLRGDTSIDDRASYDNYYIENWSLGLDVSIMLRTVATLIPRPRPAVDPEPPPIGRQPGDAS
jgi:exopolysaccharide biosynthesis polyprenyl glycosylphosphotransferase